MEKTHEITIMLFAIERATEIMKLDKSTVKKSSNDVAHAVCASSASLYISANQLTSQWHL